MKTNIFLTGVGGQGILSFAKMLGELAMIRNINVLITETHGMAQRGGSVSASIRYGDVYSSLIGIGKADILIGLEPLEAARYARMLSPDGIAIVNAHATIPHSISAVKTKYPPIENLLKIVKSSGNKVIAFDATEIGKKCGFPLAANSAILGAVAMTGRIDANVEDFRLTIEKTIPRKVNENLRAFDMGYERARLELDR